MSNYSFACVGQAGGNLGALAARHGAPVVCINSSEEDLSLLPSEIAKVHLVGGEGCHKNHQLAATLYDINYNKVLNTCAEVLDSRVVFVVGSLGGGTAGGSLPLLVQDLIEQYEDKYEAERKQYNEAVEEDPTIVIPIPKKTIVCVIGILPSLSESPRVNGNAYSSINKLRAIEGLGQIFLIDNETSIKSFNEINFLFMNQLWDFLSIPERDRDENGNFDFSEMMELLACPGFGVFCCKEGMGATDDSVIAGLKASNIFPSFNADARAKFLGISCTRKSDIEAYNKAFGPFYDYQHTYNKNGIYAMLVGLPAPTDRLELMKERYLESERVKTKEAAIDTSIDAAQFDEPEVKSVTKSARRERKRTI